MPTISSKKDFNPANIRLSISKCGDGHDVSIEYAVDGKQTDLVYKFDRCDTRGIQKKDWNGRFSKFDMSLKLSEDDAKNVNSIVDKVNEFLKSKDFPELPQDGIPRIPRSSSSRSK